ncbi:bifunctional phosphoribosylaminoimidazolecarboxamide formyltransferase/IMP cyclohydrolase [Marinicella sp. S1101]|uniref:bifunctional phosphoribosylaminoimidazolecarboxamide formyltransferase/IMP cyclohydrolase n=1 Tax=Marinicella marina TaxID=2996016 RepID=UPI002260C630|nr:bifunctional phosphoribosylaminoimidazolecarboxamide formyltransferase/IMP cyclohydrolase [Marinicella marina]MCX7552892.1 bifunctional phosphoribosylaminoimidazolecarboxamide formyltransferase/IMP cyclohydrolase [Marinicella marina]MDJ1139799.1 bifunctional phosphoribosylaminoimidazolecarboxamide formyltransferase/IMP cyclohydrolase [Marinicella marina]
MAQNRVPIRRVLISVSDKTNIEMLASGLSRLGVEILSTGGTAKMLENAGLVVTEISEYTEFPEMMDGRIKTLHPRVHGALLGRNGIDDEVMQKHGIEGIDLLVVNLYPFESTIKKADATLEQAIENIDIGGPAMIRAAAKNHDRVTVMVNPDDYEEMLDELTTYGGISHANRHILAAKAFAHTARYDGLIANYLSAINDTEEKTDFPRYFTNQFEHRSELRYGENPHQKAAFYTEQNPPAGTVGHSWQIQGKALSYNNIADADAALSCVKEFKDIPACVIVKHANPCGVALESNLTLAYLKAFATDPTSAFGGVLAFNGEVSAKTAETILDKQFAEVIIAPAYEKAALKVFATKKNLRVICCGDLPESNQPWMMYKRVSGGLLVQDADTAMIDLNDAQVVTKRKPKPAELSDMGFAWKVGKWVKSNAIVYAKDAQTIGVGAGQMSRVVSARIASIKADDAGLKVTGSVMASDAFFPFRDGIDAAAQAGITAVIQPGGSIRDEEVIQAANEHDMAMIFTGMRHFNH